MVQLSATRCSCIAILWVSLVSFAAITLCVASQRLFVVVVVVVVDDDFVIDSVRKFLDTPWYFSMMSQCWRKRISAITSSCKFGLILNTDKIRQTASNADTPFPHYPLPPPPHTHTKLYRNRLSSFENEVSGWTYTTFPLTVHLWTSWRESIKWQLIFIHGMLYLIDRRNMISEY
jgi:hypothetical protein